MTIITGIDIETTGLEQSKGHRIIEFCAILHDLDTRAEKIRYVQRIDPERAIDKKAFEVHGISPVDLAGKPKWERIAPKVSAILAKSNIIVGHNGNEFDFPFVVEELLRVGGEVPAGVKPFDTMIEGLWATPTGKRPSLRELCIACDVEYDPDRAHAADYDVEIMMKCLWFGIDSGFYELPEVA